MTRSPFFQRVTLSPTAMTSPAQSEPGTTFSFTPSGYWPLATARSRNCSETALICTSTSCALGGATGAFLRTRFAEPVYAGRRYSRVVVGRVMLTVEDFGSGVIGGRCCLSRRRDE
jgi:hypothetical protein